jgi:hypothetical protein
MKISYLIIFCLLVGCSFAFPLFDNTKDVLSERSSVPASTYFNCTDGRDSLGCNYEGICIQNTCRCDNGWTSESNSTIGCTYQQKNRFGAFFLHFFLFFFGAGEFYLGNIGFGVGQLVYNCIGTCIMCCIGLACIKMFEKPGMGCTVFIVVCWVIGSFAWWVLDLVWIGCGWRLDGNGMPIADW